MWPYSFAGSGYSRTGCWRLPLASGTNEDRVLTQMSSLRASATNTMQGELLTSHTYPIRLLQLPRAVHCVVGPWALCSFCTRDTSSSVAAGIRIPGWMRCSEEVTSSCARVPQRTTRSGGSCTSKMSLIFKPWRFTYFRLLGPRSKPRRSIYVFSWALCLHLHEICLYCTAQHSHARIALYLP